VPRQYPPIREAAVRANAVGRRMDASVLLDGEAEDAVVVDRGAVERRDGRNARLLITRFREVRGDMIAGDMCSTFTL
jgi:hypothetical protein